MLDFFAFSSNNHSNYNNNKITITSMLLLLLILLIQLPSTYSVTREYDLTLTYEPLKIDPSRLAIHGNGQHPLPTIICYSGDLIRVRIRNKLNKIKRNNSRKKGRISNDEIDAITLHFHGILQRNYNHTVDEHGNKIDNGLADGVPFVNQWPTLPGETYLYEFKVDKQTGTYFYHSHWALSTITGHGAFIVKDKPPKIYGHFEDQSTITTIANTTTSNNNNTPATIKKKEEPFIIMFSDLWAKSDETLAKGLMDPKNFTWVGPPSDLLINGNFLGDTVFLVEPKKTYRLRIIGATSLEAIVFGIYNHKMTIIEVDGSYVKPVTVDSLLVSPGERYSVLITTDQTPGDYNILSEIRLRNDTTINSRDPRATLRYVTSPPLPPSPKPMNVPTLPVPYPPPIKFEMLTDSEPMPKKSDRTLILSTNQDLTTTNVQSDTSIIRWSVNNNVFKDFKSPILLDLISGARSRDVDWNALNSTTGYDKNRKTYPIKDCEVIDLVFQNTIGLSGGCDYHPWHLHGHKFWDITFGPGTFPNGLDMTNVVEYPVARDTTLVYPGISTNGTKLGDGCGWRLVRFVADNPGVWAAHCHITPHMVMGMMTLFEEAIDKLPHIPSLSIKPTA